MQGRRRSLPAKAFEAYRCSKRGNASPTAKPGPQPRRGRRRHRIRSCASLPCDRGFVPCSALKPGRPALRSTTRARQISASSAPKSMQCRRSDPGRRAVPMIPFSILDLAPVPEGSTPGDALSEFARSAHAMPSGWGYRRFWLAEHHNMVGIASAATAVVIGHVAGGTTHDPRRLGRHHAAEPCAARHRRAVRHARIALSRPHRSRPRAGRRAPTSAPSRALRRDPASADNFPQDVLELQALLWPTSSRARACRRCPAAACMCRSGSSARALFGAQLAAMLGLPYAFASHFAPDALMQALDVYRAMFEPSEQLDKPYAMVGVNVFAADTRRARRTASSPRRSRRSPTCSAARAASCRRRSTTSTPIGRRPRRRRRPAC